MNEYDSAKIADLLADEDNFELTTNEHEADLMVLNTCSIREKAQEKVFHQIGRWKKIKDKNPNLKIAIGGCVASQEGEKIIKRAPTVDIVFGPQSLHKLPKLYNERVILDHGMKVGKELANVLSGGDTTPDKLLTEDNLFQLELTSFMNLIETDKTKDRIRHTLATGKPLVN